jgi:hypothetical protein
MIHVGKDLMVFDFQLHFEFGQKFHFQGPPMKPHDYIKQSRIADANGYVDVDKESLQHKKYSNIFAIGDCTNLPTSKTAAAIAAQGQILYKNLSQVMNGKSTVLKVYNDQISMLAFVFPISRKNFPAYVFRLCSCVFTNVL